MTSSSIGPAKLPRWDATAGLRTAPTADLTSPLIPSLLIAAKAAMLAAFAAYNVLSGVTSIETFSSGALTTHGIADKARDYAAAISFVLAAVVAFICTYEFLKWSARRVPAPAMVSFFRSIILANLPAFFALGTLPFASGFDPTLLVYASIGECVLLLCLLIYLITGRTNAGREDAPRDHLFDWILPVLLFSSIAGAATPSGWAAFWSIREGSSLAPAEFVRISRIGEYVSLLTASLACAFIFALQGRISLHKGVALLFTAAQIYLLAAAVRFVGPLIQVDGRLDYAATLSTAGIAILAVWTVASAAQVIVRTTHVFGAEEPIDWLRHALPVTALAAALAAVLLKGHARQLNLMDDYHTGEFVLPYWSWKTFGLLPYVDLAPARGWLNVLYGFVIEEGIGSGYGNYRYGFSLISLPVFAFLFVALRWAIGTWPALLLTFLAPAVNGISEIDVVNTAFLAILCRGAFALRPTTWLVLWAVLGTAAVFFAPGQGALLVIATGILGIWQFYRSMKSEPGFLLRAVGAGAFVLAALALLTPALPLLLGAIRYGLEQSQANTEANAVPWAVGRGRSSVTNSVLWEIFRSAWLFVTAGIGIATYLGIRKNKQNRIFNPHFVLGIPLFALGVLFVFRAGARIDPGSWSRLGIASVWFVGLALPLYVYFCWGRRTSPLIVASLVALAGSLPVPSGYWKMESLRAIPAVSASALTAGDSAGLTQLGNAALKPERLDNIAALKRFADSRLEPSGTFLDLTNRSTLYYLLDRRPPMEVAAYNLTNLTQQLRAVRKLESNPPGLALAASETIRHDGGSLSLRAHPLYRYVLDNYRPVESEGAIWLVRRPEQERALSAENTDAELDLLMRAFAQRELGPLPSVWGEAWNNLVDDIGPLHEIDLRSPVLSNIRQEPNGALISTNHDPYLVVDIARMGLSGSEAGLLVFDFECNGQKKPASLQVFWTNERMPQFSEGASVKFKGRDGRLVVPLDSSPAWVLGGRVQKLRFDLDDWKACDSWRISNAALTQRTYVETVQELRSGSR